MTREKPLKKRVHQWTLAQLLEHGVFHDSWREVDVDEATRIARDARTGAQVGLVRSGMSVGYSVQGAAKELGVSRQRVHQLLDAGLLEAFELLDDAKLPAGLFITPSSLADYERSGRKPGRRPSVKALAVKSSRRKTEKGR